MRVLWTKREAAYDGELVKFPAVRCEPKPVQTSGVPVLLGAHGPKALERVARTYDGWMPLVESADELKRQVAKLRELAQKHGRDSALLDISPLVDPMENGPSRDDLERYRDAGANRVILLSQKSVAETADGKALELVRRFAATVERARGV
jgi:alkanesulfonate monooxygenase SsuD/methylene tetrahydromethanopterin reductase-like flavin-dependent oxidoreductase (luciferase family)